MFATPIPELGQSLFTAASMLIAIPTAVQIFCWLATIWAGRPELRTPMLYILGFTGHDFTVELEVVEDALVGQLLPGRECRVVLTTPGGRVSEDSVSPDGFFLVPHEGRGPIRLEFQAADFHLATDWISL